MKFAESGKKMNLWQNGRKKEYILIGARNRTFIKTTGVGIVNKLRNADEKNL